MFETEPKPGLGVAMVAALVIAGALLLASPLAGEQALLAVALFVAFGLVLAFFYVALVALPVHRLESRLADSERTLQAFHRAIEEGLEDLRNGDLVAVGRPIDGLPERAQLSLSSAVRSLAALVSQIQGSSVEVAVAGKTVQETASELASGSAEQAAAVVEITATMEELARTAAQIAGNAASQAEHAVGAKAAGDEGAAAVEKAVAGVAAVSQRIAAIATSADELGGRSREIYRVLDLINDLSRETHILALNAAVEASAAGEHGRRFAVVADEVRRLAERSRESVESVRGLLGQFATSIQSTVVATEEGAKEVGQVLDQTRSAASSIEQLRLALGDTSRAAKEISMATQEQRTASDQAVLTLKEVSEVVQRMADGLRQFSGAADHLHQVALSIQLLTQSFHLDSDRSLKHLVEGWTAELAGASASGEAVESELRSVAANNPFIELLFVVDHHGNMLHAAASSRVPLDADTRETIAVGRNFSDRPWFQGVLRDSRPTVTSLYDSALTGDRCFTVAAPIRLTNGQLFGVLGVDINARGWTEI